MDLKSKGIAHYNRMIAWALTRPEEEHADHEEMEKAIDEKWYDENCDHCLFYNYNCNDCALDTGNHFCCNGLWVKMNFATTWVDWVIAARNIQYYINVFG